MSSFKLERWKSEAKVYRNDNNNNDSKEEKEGWALVTRATDTKVRFH